MICLVCVWCSAEIIRNWVLLHMHFQFKWLILMINNKKTALLLSLSLSLPRLYACTSKFTLKFFVSLDFQWIYINIFMQWKTTEKNEEKNMEKIFPPHCLHIYLSTSTLYTSVCVLCIYSPWFHLSRFAIKICVCHNSYRREFIAYNIHKIYVINRKKGGE